MAFQLTTRTGHPDFLDLPWDRPLAGWDSERLVEVSTGIHRHVVRFVAYPDGIYALKELPQRLAEREYRLLRELESRSLPVVEPVGRASDRSPDAGHPLGAVLITRHLDFSLPYRALFERGVPHARDRLVDALAGLLVRLHLTGFYWGDCSLSNALFRRDAGALAAYLVDAETGELHDELTDGQRGHDLDIAVENIAGELLDVEAAFGVGFDVEEVEVRTTDAGLTLRLHTHVVEPGHHQRRLMSLTGLHVQENQARRLLNDIVHFKAHLEDSHGESLPDAVVAFRWLGEVFEPTVAAIPDELHGKREAPELFHEVLEHKYLRSRASGRDVGLEEAVDSYVDEVLRHQPDERAVLDP